MIAALCAYIGQTIHPGKIGITPSTLEIVTLLIFVLAFLFCFKRLENGILVFQINHSILYNGERKAQLVSGNNSEPIINKCTGEILTPNEIIKEIHSCDIEIPLLTKKLNSAKKKTKKYYDYRNWTILFGFILFLVSKIWSAYV